ncbi:MAG TPA: glycosyltransferase family 2 protein [Cyclobacteriaceae bacterium]|jgi:GT2 family glycosyltransferase|nr:glycosyltransferase family 2 protein [Cyclobacteriaceae bacterium]HRE66741.1 glycosyltransferase family 2 protein [Cyclobacteriaceae bacterium]HRF33555.1 glycosyltransferase family 2 protein [Cyclobacteriaceae bacterium]
MIETAVVILNYNGKHFLQKFLPGVITHSGSAKIIVADNASTDDSVHFLKENFSNQVQILQLDSNTGYCGGYNNALKQIQAEYYVLLNSDVEVTPGWIDPVIKLFKQDASIAAAQPKILSYHTRNEFEYAGAAGGFIDSFGYPFCRGRIFNTFEKDTGQYNDTRPVFWATGACLFIRSKIFHQHGGFDKDFFAHMEEIDLCWRIQRSGLKVFYAGNSHVYHVGGGTLSKANPRKTYFNFRNGLSLLIKNLPERQLYWKIPIRLILDWLAATNFLLAGLPADAWAVIKAHGSFIKNLRLDYRKRTVLPVPINQINTIFSGLLPASFYLKGKRHFSDFRF